jgi:hypothetical protein
MVFCNGYDLYSKLLEYVSVSTSLQIFSPYIKLDALKSLVENNSSIHSVVVRWEPKDIVTGASDIEIFPFLYAKGIPLYRNPRLHLKAYLDDSKQCFITSANISSRAFNYPIHQFYNYEIGTVVDHLSVKELLYFQSITAESTLITEYIYEDLIQQIAKSEFSQESQEFIIPNNPAREFLISSLPMSFDIDSLYKVYEGYPSTDNTELNCAVHDLALYNIPLGLGRSEFLNALSSSFFSHRFIAIFLQSFEAKGEIYFGSAKDWIHSNCTDVPLPRKWDITVNIQILYRWIVTLGEGKYSVDRPNYSERLFIT